MNTAYKITTPLGCQVTASQLSMLELALADLRTNPPVGDSWLVQAEQAGLESIIEELRELLVVWDREQAELSVLFDQEQS